MLTCLHWVCRAVQEGFGCGRRVGHRAWCANIHTKDRSRQHKLWGMRLCRHVQSSTCAACAACHCPQVLLHSCRCCPQLCEAAVITGLPDVLLRSACTSGNSTATLSLLLLANVVSGVGAAADAMAAGLPAPGSPAAAAAAAAEAGRDVQPGQQQQQDQRQEQWVKARRQQLAAALQVVKPCPATDAVIVKLAGKERKCVVMGKAD